MILGLSRSMAIMTSQIVFKNSRRIGLKKIQIMFTSQKQDIKTKTIEINQNFEWQIIKIIG